MALEAWPRSDAVTSSGTPTSASHDAKVRRRSLWLTGAMSVRRHPGSVTWVQRFGGHLNLNVHFHALVSDGVFTRAAGGRLYLRELDPPGDEDVAALTRCIVRRIRALLDSGPDRAAEVPADALGAAQATAVMARPPADGDGDDNPWRTTLC